MEVHFGLSALHAEWASAVVCVGTFDGVHEGHQAVISRAVEEARSKELPCCLVTFDRHPAAVLHPESVPPALGTLEENMEAIDALGVAVCLILPFDKALSETTAERFLWEILVDALKAESVVIGHDFAMGKGRRGDAEWLRQHIACTVVPPFEIEGRRVSSSEIRHAIAAGDVERAAKLLGRSFAVSGVVVPGQRLGRTLGYPTANIGRSFNLVLPADGIYAAQFLCDGDTYWAAVSIGVRPAVGGGQRTVEAYLLDYGGRSLYGKSCRLSLLRRLREERNFSSIDGLTTQIGLDVEEVRRIARSREFATS